ncbi:MAG: SdpI family protein [Clostridia bacterium]|nr:SdpI family protein [Clostridia bacterium]
MKFNKVLLIVTSILILLPILVGVFTWNILPEQMATHFGISGDADGFGSRVFAVFGFPVLMLVFHWLCIFASCFDKSNRDQNKKAYNMVLWITPLISWFCSGMMYALAFGIEFDMYSLMAGVFGAMFLVIGNYMPKIKHNHTLGIKISWTLESEENWNATHRMAGKVWFVIGLLALVCVFVPYKISMFALPALLFIAIAIPVVYSYRFHQNEKKEGKTFMKNQKLRKYYIITGVIVAVILAAIGYIMFSGDIEISYTDDGIVIDSMYCSPYTIKYTDIGGTQYSEDYIDGAKVNGFNSAKLLLGIFKNDSYGNYQRYTYTGNNGFIIIETMDEKYIIIGAKTLGATRELYNEIADKIAGE